MKLIHVEFFVSAWIMFLFDCGYALTSCFTGYNSLDHTCSLSSRVHEERSTPDECCAVSNIKAFATNITGENKTTVKCNSCISIQNKDVVYCFSLIYWIGERSCSHLHPVKAASMQECCMVKGYPNDVAQGFSKQLIHVNKSIPTYECTPCIEVIDRASIWTEWSKCNVECGGGIKTRYWICNQTVISHQRECFGERTETMDCNMQSCKLTLTLTIIIIVATICIVGLIIALILCYCMKKNGLGCCIKLSVTDDTDIRMSNTHEMKKLSTNDTYFCSRTPSIPRYHPDPVTFAKNTTNQNSHEKLRLSKEIEEQRDKGKFEHTGHPTDCHEYEEFDKDPYYIQSDNAYLPMK